MGSILILRSSGSACWLMELPEGLGVGWLICNVSMYAKSRTINLNKLDDTFISFVPMHISFSPDGKFLLVSSDKNRLILFSWETGKQIANFYGATNDELTQPRHCWDPSGKYIYGTSQDYSIYVWEIRSQKLVSRLNGHTSTVLQYVLLMEEEHLLSHLLPPLPLPLSSCAAATRCFHFPDSPPLTPALADTATITTSIFTSTTTTTTNFTSSALITPRTPRKPAHPCHSALSSVNREKSAIISFKMVQGCDRNLLSPSLHISSCTPSKHQASVSTSARRRLWILPKDVCEPFTLESHTPRHYRHHGDNGYPPARGELKETLPPKSAALYGEGVEDDDEIDNSPDTSFSPPHSPGYHETTSETAAKPSSSSYPPHPHYPHHRHLLQPKEKRGYAQYTSPKIKSSQKSKTCASCKTKKTPLWRDSEDGIPYCNACGIRFKKYRVRCSSCLYIPRKDEREVSKCCCHCGYLLIHCKIHG